MQLKIWLVLTFLTGMGAMAAEPDYRPAALTREIKNLTGSANFGLESLAVHNVSAVSQAPFGKFFTVTASGTSLKYAYTGRVNSCRAGGCGNYQAGAYAELSEFFDYFILFDTAGAVMTVRVYNYQATHGQEITVKGWLKQFTGYNGKRDLRVGKEVDSITGATISVYAITDDIREKAALLKNHLTKLP